MLNKFKLFLIQRFEFKHVQHFMCDDREILLHLGRFIRTEFESIPHEHRIINTNLSSFSLEVTTWTNFWVLKNMTECINVKYFELATLKSNSSNVGASET